MVMRKRLVLPSPCKSDFLLFDLVSMQPEYTGHSYWIGAATTAAFLKLPAWLISGPQIVSNGISRHTHPGCHVY